MSKPRKHVLLAAAGSVGLHVALLFAWALTVPWFSKAQRTAARAAEPIKLVIEEPTPEPTVVPAPVSTSAVRFLDTASMPEAATPPPDTAFESGKNTAAASELPGTGTNPLLPTQAGTKSASFAIATRDYVAGEERGDAVPVSTPPLQTAPPLPRAVAQAKPSAPAPTATPPPQAGDFALAKPRPVSTEPAADEEPNPYDPSVRNTEPPLPTPVPLFGQGRGTYRPQETKTAMSGSINNRGPSSIASASTPTGRYQATVMEAIRRRWSRYIENRADVASIGTVKIHFLVGMDGHARQTTVVANTANEALASISLQAITDAAIPPMPADAIPHTGGGQLPVEITFEFLE